MINKFGRNCFAVFLILIIHSGQLRCDELMVVYTAGSSGKLMSCNCPNDPYGGLSERVTLINDLRQSQKPFLLVDGGNMLSLFGDFEAKAECVFGIMNLMKYDAAGIGCNEMFHGLKSAEKISETADFPLISAAFAKSGVNSPAFKPYVTTDIGGKKVGIISICDSTTQSRLGQPQVNDYSFLPSSGVFRSAISEVSSTCDFTIVLSQFSPEENMKLSDDYPEIDLIVEVYGNKKYDSPIETPHGIIVSPGSRGQFVGLITIGKSESEKTSVISHEFIPVLNITENDDARKIIIAYYDKIREMN